MASKQMGYRTKRGSKWDKTKVEAEIPRPVEVVVADRRNGPAVDDLSVLSVYQEDIDGSICRR